MSTILRSIFHHTRLFFSSVSPAKGHRRSFSFTAFHYIVPLLLLVLAACHSSSQDKAANKDSATIILPEPPSISAAEMNRLHAGCQAWYDTVLKSKGFNGGMIVAKNGNIVFEQYSGTIHLPGHDTITASTPMQIASVSKTFTAMAVLKLQQDGKVNIDETFATYFPGFNYPDITIRNLLSHRSGLPDYMHFLEALKWDKKKIASNQDVFDFLVAHKTEFTNLSRPGIRFNYCNTNFALLALLVEKISGKPFPEYLKETFFDPLQMKHTFVFTLADSLRGNPSYDWKGRPMEFNFLDAVYGDKNIYTTPGDLLTWDQALRSDKLFTAATLEQAYAPYSNEKAGIRNYGLGWRMNIYPTGKKMIYHNGWWHGCNAAFIRLLDEGATIIVIGNKFTRAIYHSRALTNLFGDYQQIDEEEAESMKTADSIATTKRAPVKKAVKEKKAPVPSKKGKKKKG